MGIMKRGRRVAAAFTFLGRSPGCEDRQDEEQKTSHRPKHQPSPLLGFSAQLSTYLFRSLRAPRCTEPKGDISTAFLPACADVTFAHIRNLEFGAMQKLTA
jgi:hypothetical protein